MCIRDSIFVRGHFYEIGIAALLSRVKPRHVEKFRKFRFADVGKSELGKKETCAKHKIDRSLNGQSNNEILTFFGIWQCERCPAVRSKWRDLHEGRHARRTSCATLVERSPSVRWKFTEARNVICWRWLTVLYCFRQVCRAATIVDGVDDAAQLKLLGSWQPMQPEEARRDVVEST